MHLFAVYVFFFLHFYFILVGPILDSQLTQFNLSGTENKHKSINVL